MQAVRVCLAALAGHLVRCLAAAILEWVCLAADPARQRVRMTEPYRALPLPTVITLAIFTMHPVPTTAKWTAEGNNSGTEAG